MKKRLLFMLLLSLICGLVFGKAQAQQQSSTRTTPAQAQQQSPTRTTPAQAQQQSPTRTTPAQAQQQTPPQTTPAQAQQQTPPQTTPAQAQQQTPPQTTPAQAQQQSPSQTTPAQPRRQSPSQTTPSQPRTSAQNSVKKTPDQAVLVLDINPFMWIFSGIPDENNNRSIFFDIGVQYNVIQDIALRFNPSFSLGFTGETAFTDSPIDFFEVELPLTFICFPFPTETYLSPTFFGVSIICTYYSTLHDDSDDTVFMSIGAMMELGYQFMFSNRLTITPSIGISRIFPKPVNGGTASVPNFNIYSPWTADTPVAPRIRVTLGFWL